MTDHADYMAPGQQHDTDHTDQLSALKDVDHELWAPVICAIARCGK